MAFLLVEPLERLLKDIGLVGPIGAASVLVADVLLARLINRDLRRGLKFSVGLAWLYLTLSTVRCFTVAGGDIDAVLKVFSAVGLAMAVAQTLFLITVDFIVGRNGKKPLLPLVRYGLLGITYLIAALVGLRAGGVTTFGVLASGAVVLGGVGAAVAEVLRQVGAGILVQYARPFEVGDTIQVMPMNVRGAVVTTSWRTTTLRTVEGVDLLVPNNDIVTHTVINYGHGNHPFRREITFDAAYDAPPDDVRDAVLGSLRDVDGIEAEPPVQVHLVAYRDSSISYAVRFWTRQVLDFENVEGKIRARVYYAFARAGLSFPNPVRELVLSTKKARTAAERAEACADALATTSLFQTLDRAALLDVASLGREQRWGKDELVLAAGEMGGEMHVLLEGEVAVQSPKDRRELLRLSAGDFFGEMSLLTAAPRAATVVTTAHSRTFAIDEHRLRTIVERHPEVADALGEALGARQANLAELIEDRPTDSATNRRLKSLIMDRLKGLFGFGKT